MGRTSYNLDQALHLGCKVVWLVIWINVLR